MSTTTHIDNFVRSKEAVALIYNNNNLYAVWSSAATGAIEAAVVTLDGFDEPPYIKPLRIKNLEALSEFCVGFNQGLRRGLFVAL